MRAQTAAHIAGVTRLLTDVLDRDSATTVAAINEVGLENRGIAGLPVQAYRAELSESRS